MQRDSKGEGVTLVKGQSQKWKNCLEIDVHRVITDK